MMRFCLRPFEIIVGRYGLHIHRGNIWSNTFLIRQLFTGCLLVFGNIRVQIDYHKHKPLMDEE